MKKFLSLFLVASLFMVIALPAFAAAEFTPKAEYRCHTPSTDNTTWAEGLYIFTRLAKERTGLNLKVYHSSQLISGKQASEYQFIRNGTIDFSFTSPANFSTSVPAADLFSLPWFIASYPDKYKAIEAIYNGESGKKFAEIFKEAGIIVFGWGENGFRELHYSGSHKPVIVPDDIKGMKLRFVSSPLYRDNLITFDANPVAINWNEALTAFQQGVVDGGENTWSIIINNRLYDFHKQVTEWSYVATPLIFTANEDIWNSFPPEIQETLRQCAHEAGLWTLATARLGLDDGWGKKYLEDNNMYPPDRNIVPSDEPYEFLKQQGVTINVLTPEQIKPWLEKTKPLYEKWVPIVGEELVELARKDMDAVFKK